jgi:hypothetical protein
VVDLSGELHQVDRYEVAARLRALLTPALSSTRLRTVAARLDVTASVLRASIDESEPHPSAAVVLAVVRQYGVDPTWILTGEYNAVTHREALEHPASVERLLARTALRNDLLDRPPPRRLASDNSVRRDTHAERAD